MSDYSVVYFTGLKKGFSIPSVLAKFQIFGHSIEIRWYGVLIALGFLLGLLAATRLAKKQNMNVDKLFDCIIYGTISAIIGARLFFVIFQWQDYKNNLGDIFKIREGGLAIYGGIIFAIITAYIVCKIRKISILKVLDVAAIGFLIGQGIGRWGNFTNQEAFGTNTTSVFGMASDKVKQYITINQADFLQKGFDVDPNIPVHPTFLYESVWCIIGAILLYVICSKFKKFDGQIILSYGAWYGFERTIVEGLRTDSLYIGSSNIRISQAISLILVIICIVLIIYNLYKVKKLNSVLYKQDITGAKSSSLVSESVKTDKTVVKENKKKVEMEDNIKDVEKEK